MDVDIRYLPNQDPGAILCQIRAIPDVEIEKCATWKPAVVSRDNPYVLALREAARRFAGVETLSVGRDGASDATTFLDQGIPAVEFGPTGAGHHGPDEWVSVASLTTLPAGPERLHRDPARAPGARRRSRTSPSFERSTAASP